MEMIRLFQLQLEHYEKVEGEELSLEGKANQLSQMVRSHLPAAMQGLAVVLLFAGYNGARNTGSDVRVEEMLRQDMIESGVRRVGAEQEMFLIDRAHKPAPRALDILDVIDDSRFTHELGLFNLEANLSPHRLGGNCLREMESELQEIYRKARETAARFDCEIALVGILPTLTKGNLGLESMVPTERYYALNEAICQMRGKDFEFTINGIDQLSVQHDNVMLEACNTSFQVHFQVSPDRFATRYNIAQAVAAPVMAAALHARFFSQGSFAATSTSTRGVKAKNAESQTLQTFFW